MAFNTHTLLPTNRLYNLDYLRGMAAFGIMVFHCLTWTTGEFMASTFMARLGVYGVAIFYVLSGLTLFYVYYDKMLPLKSTLFSFIKKRVFRLFPLLWLATLLAILIAGKMPDIGNLFLSLSGLFGFFRWDFGFSAGVWSIGNELVFYVFFPFFILFSRSYKPLMVLLSLVIFGLYIYFTFYNLNRHSLLTQQWDVYVNPLNQAFFFLGGFLIGLFFKHSKVHNLFSLLLLCLGVGVFIYYPVYGFSIYLVTGVNRLVFTFCCFVICFSFYKLTIKLPGAIHKPLVLLGEASYSVYLLHPLVYNRVNAVFLHFDKQTRHYPITIMPIISMLVTLVLSYLVYQYFEKFFTNLAKDKKTKAVGTIPID